MEEKDNKNQTLEEQPAVQPWEIKNPFIREAKSLAVKAAVQQLIGINPKTWAELEAKGTIPTSGTYEEYLQKIVKHYQQRQDLALEKLRIDTEKEKEKESSKSRSKMIFDTESGLSPIQEAEIIQKIRVNKARERQIHLANMLTSKEMLHRSALLDLTTPMISNIANILRQAAEETPELQETIDNCFKSLHKMGEKLLEQCKEDEAVYIELLTETPIDLDVMLDKGVHVY